MPTGRSQGVAALVVAAAGLLLTFVFGFLSFTPGVDPEIADFLQLGFFVGGLVMVGGVVAYFVTSRRASGDAPSKFDRLLEQRAAALAAVPVGLGAVLIGALWYLTRMLGEGGALGDAGPLQAGEKFAVIDTAGIGAFLGFGSLYVIGATYLAIRAERAAIRLARQESGVKLS